MVNKKLNKRIFDLIFSIIGLIIFGWIIIILGVICSIDTRKSGFFFQKRIGLKGKSFQIIKLRTMTSRYEINYHITTKNDPRVTKLGRFLRKYKLDEFPQLFNILKGEMSFVGPRPDLESFVFLIPLKEREIILSVKPGITSLATLKFRDEESILSKEKNPIDFNNEILIPEKTKLNIEYIKKQSIMNDISIIFKTIFSISR